MLIRLGFADMASTERSKPCWPPIVPHAPLLFPSTFQRRVFGLVDHTHAAPADFGGDLVVADRLAYHDGVILPVRR